MATVQTRALVARTAMWLLPALLVLVAAGCVTTSTSFWQGDGPPAPCQACQLACVWQNSVHTVADSTKGGQPLPGFAGRVYLFGPNVDFPLVSEGTLTVDLIDETYDPANWVERFNIDSETFQRLLKKDMIGWGYTVFLPSARYRPEMTKIRLRVGFQQAKAAPIYTENIVTLAPMNGVIREGKTPLTWPGARPAAPGPTLPPSTPPAPPASPRLTLPPPTPK